MADIHRQLVDRCRKGDRQAQFELYKLYHKAMYNTALRIVVTQQDAEDIMQESFLSAFAKIEAFKGEVSFGAWLKKIVINRSLDLLRKKRMIFEDLDKAEATPDPRQEEKAEDSAYDIKKIREAISALPDGYRTILSLYLLEGYDHEEIAGILGISPVTSRTQYSRARNRLRELLKEKEKDG